MILKLEKSKDCRKRQERIRTRKIILKRNNQLLNNNNQNLFHRIVPAANKMNGLNLKKADIAKLLNLLLINKNIK